MKFTEANCVAGRVYYPMNFGLYWPAERLIFQYVPNQAYQQVNWQIFRPISTQIIPIQNNIKQEIYK